MCESSSSFSAACGDEWGDDLRQQERSGDLREEVVRDSVGESVQWTRMV